MYNNCVTRLQALYFICSSRHYVPINVFPDYPLKHVWGYSRELTYRVFRYPCPIGQPVFVKYHKRQKFYGTKLSRFTGFYQNVGKTFAVCF